MRIIKKKRFQKSFQKLVQNKPSLEKRVFACLRDLKEKGLQSSYYRKPLKGLGANVHELQVGGDLRILIEVFIVDDKAYLLNIGTHSELELSSSKKIKY